MKAVDVEFANKRRRWREDEREMSITPTQCRAARELVKWSRLRLAVAANIGPFAVIKFESGNPFRSPNDIEAMKRALEEAGVIFFERNGKAPGVTLRLPERAVVVEDLNASSGE